MLAFKPNLLPKCTLYAFSSVPNFKAIGLCIQVLWQFFCKCLKRREKTMKLCKFLQTSISEMAEAIFFKLSM